MATVEGHLATGRPVRIRLAGDRIDAIQDFPGAPDVLVLPGLIGIQVNGYGGHDVNGDQADGSSDPDAIADLTAALWRHGVTTFCPTVVTDSPESMTDRLRHIAEARDSDPLVAASIPGVHVEGPYLSAEDGARGAHSIAWVRDPDLAEFRSWQDACGGLVRIVTVAPERAGAAEFIDSVSDAGVVVSIGHSAATPAQIRTAVAAGARLSTHLGNGIPSLIPRHDNPVWPQLATDELIAGFIGDGHHLPADAFTAMVRAKGLQRSVLVSDSVALAGCAPGRYATPVGGEVVVEPDGRVRLADTDYLAGSGASMDQCLAWVAKSTPFSLEEAVSMACRNPARVLGLGDRGDLHPGARADLALFATDLRLLTTIVAGRRVHG